MKNNTSLFSKAGFDNRYKELPECKPAETRVVQLQPIGLDQSSLMEPYDLSRNPRVARVMKRLGL